MDQRLLGGRHTAQVANTARKASDMSGFWSSETMTKKLGKLVDPFEPGNIKHGAYEMRLGDEAYVPNPRDNDGDNSLLRIALGDRDRVIIPPGQFAVLLTREVVKIPADAIGLISMRSKYKLRGLVNVSGFHVDPGYKGHLLFSVLNAGTQEICLDKIDRLFLLWYVSLDRKTRDVYTKDGKSAIDSSVIDNLRGTPYNPAQLSTTIHELEERLQSIERFYRFIKWIGGIALAIIIAVLSALAVKALDSSEENGQEDTVVQIPQ